MAAWIALGVIEFILAGLLTAYMLRYYASKATPTYALVIIYISWYLGFFGTLFLPIDIAEAYASQYTNTTNITEWVNGSTGGGGWPGPTMSVLPLPSGNASLLPSPSPLASATASPSFMVIQGTPTATYTYTPPSVTPTNLPPGASQSNTPTATATGTSTATGAATRTGTATAVAGSATPSVGPPTSTRTSTAIPSRLPSKTPSTTPTATATGTATATKSRAPTGGRPSASSSPINADCESGCGRLLQGNATASASAAAAAAAASRSPAAASASSAAAAASASASASKQPVVIAGSNSSSITNSSGGEGSGSNATTWEIEQVLMQVRNPTLEGLWSMVYWVTFLLTYIIIPVTQEYVAAGEFTRCGRFKASVKINIIFYAAIGLIAFAALAYVILGLNQDLWDLLPLLISLANSFGLIIIVLLMGYGTAEVPKQLWARGDNDLELRRLFFQASELDGTLFEAKQVLGDYIKDVQEFAARITAMAGDQGHLAQGDNMKKAAELQRCVVIVEKKMALAQELLGKSIKLSSGARKAAEMRDKEDEEDEEEGGGGWFSGIKNAFKSNNKYKGVTIAKLAKLHKKLVAQIAKVKKTQFRWDKLMIRCLELEYTAAGHVPPVPQKKKTHEGKTLYIIPRGSALAEIPNSPGSAPKPPQRRRHDPSVTGGADIGDDMEILSERAATALTSMMCCPRWFNGFFNNVLWKFRMTIKPAWYKTLSVLAEIMSILLLWSEATIWINLHGLVNNNLSVFGLILRAADSLGNHSYVAIQIAALIPLTYMCLVSTYAVFKLKLFDMLDLAGDGNSDPYSMLVNASLFNRLQFSLAFNFLNVLMHSNNKADYPNTAFLTSVGAKMSLSVVDWYLPILMVVIYLAHKCSLFDRCMRKIGIEEKGDPVKGDASHERLIAEGRTVVRRARRRLGLGGDDGMSEEDLERQEALAKDRFAAVMARAQARREGRNVDEVAALDLPGAAGGHGGAGAGGEELAGRGTGYATSGPSFMSSKQGMVSLDAFSTKGTPGKAGLASLAAKAGGKLGLGLGSAAKPADAPPARGEDDEYGLDDDLGRRQVHFDDEESYDLGGGAGRGGGGSGGGSGGRGGHGEHLSTPSKMADPRAAIAMLTSPPPEQNLAALLKGKSYAPKAGAGTPQSSQSLSQSHTPQQVAAAHTAAMARPGGGPGSAVKAGLALRF